MIRYSCDLCGRNLDSQRRFALRREGGGLAALNPATPEDEDDRDHLQEIQDILEGLEESRASRSARTCTSRCASISARSAAESSSRARWDAKSPSSATSARTEAGEAATFRQTPRADAALALLSLPCRAPPPSAACPAPLPACRLLAAAGVPVPTLAGLLHRLREATLCLPWSPYDGFADEGARETSREQQPDAQGRRDRRRRDRAGSGGRGASRSSRRSPRWKGSATS